MLTQGSKLLYYYKNSYFDKKPVRLSSLSILQKNKTDFSIDTARQEVTFYYSEYDQPEKVYVVSYKEIRSLGSLDFLPTYLTSNMIFDGKFILKALGLVDSNYQDEGAFRQGNILAEVEYRNGNLYLVNYRLQYLQHRSGYYFGSKKGTEQYIKYYGDHETGKPTKIEVLLGEASQIQDYSIEYTHYPYNAVGSFLDGEDVILVKLNDEFKTFVITDLVEKVSDQRNLNFIQKNGDLISATDDDPLYKWRMYYEKFNNNDYLNCAKSSCFKEIYNKTAYYSKVKDLRRLIKATEDKKLKPGEFKNKYVPLFLNVSREQSKFYKEIAESESITISVKNDMDTLVIYSSIHGNPYKKIMTLKHSGIHSRFKGISTVVDSLY